MPPCACLSWVRNGTPQRGRQASTRGGGEGCVVVEDLFNETEGSYSHAYVSCADKVKYVQTPHGMVGITVPQNHRQAMQTVHAQQWLKAEEVEIDTCEGMGTWVRVPRSSLPKGTRIYKCKFAYDVKELTEKR